MHTLQGTRLVLSRRGYEEDKRKLSTVGVQEFVDALKLVRDGGARAAMRHPGVSKNIKGVLPQVALASGDVENTPPERVKWKHQGCELTWMVQVARPFRSWIQKRNCLATCTIQVSSQP